MNEHEKILEIIRLKDQAPLQFDVDHAALLVIDMQRYFVSPDYSFGETIEKLVSGASEGYFRRVTDVVAPNIKRLWQLSAFVVVPFSSREGGPTTTAANYLHG